MQVPCHVSEKECVLFLGQTEICPLFSRQDLYFTSRFSVLIACIEPLKKKGAPPMGQDAMKKPNLFIIGQQKSGTTALRDFLNQHPGIFFPVQDEMHHFESDLLKHRLIHRRRINPYLVKRFNILPEDYMGHYKAVDNEIMIGDKTPTYLFSKTAAAEIYDFNPDAKIIAIFREPVSFLYSVHSQNLYNVYENEANFETALALEESRKLGAHLSPRGKAVAYLMFYRERIDYTRQLMRFVKLFPPGRIKCIIFEDFKKDNLKILTEVFRFLEVDPDFVPQTGIVNPTKRRRLKRLKQIIAPMAITGIPRKIIPSPIYRRLRERFIRTSTVYAQREPMNPALEQRLKKECKPIVIQFNHMLHEWGLIGTNTDLAELWGYDTI